MRHTQEEVIINKTSHLFSTLSARCLPLFTSHTLCAFAHAYNRPSSTSKQSGLWLVRRYSLIFFFFAGQCKQYEHITDSSMSVANLLQFVNCSYISKGRSCVLLLALRSTRGRCTPNCPSSDGRSAGPPLVFDNNDSVDNVHILTIGPQNYNNFLLVCCLLFFEVIHHGAVCAQKVCVLPTGLKRAC